MPAIQWSAHKGSKYLRAQGGKDGGCEGCFGGLFMSVMQAECQMHPRRPGGSRSLADFGFFSDAMRVHCPVLG
jgi:hypothetical protein